MSPHLDTAFFESIPNGPGVYFMLSERQQILYIGKAKLLRRRLKSYRRVRADTHPENVVRLVGKIREIRWELCRNEEQALIRENELLHAIRPPYNIADTEPENYLYVCVRPLKRKGFVEFQLTSEPSLDDGEGWVFGCYKNRLRTRRGFMALMRLIFSSNFEGPRFSIPSRLGRSRSVYSCVLPFSEESFSTLSKFFRGQSLAFIRALTEKLVANESVPRFMGPAIQDDIDEVRAFFKSGPKATRLLKRGSRVRGTALNHDQMDDLILRTLSIFSSEQPLNSLKLSSEF